MNQRMESYSHAKYRPTNPRVPVNTAPATIPTVRGPAVIVHAAEAHQRHDRNKRLFDRTVAIVIALPVAIMVLFAACLIRLTSKGPAIYRQTRLGRFGKTFTIYKLRTMSHNCEAVSGAMWSTKGDTRITWLGRVLRTLHIDEMPQLWNVWKGEMSLVGPRPERPEIATNLRKEIAGYDRRLEVLPGVTGVAQVHLPPDETMDCVRKKLVFDRYYVRFSSLMHDVKILFLTGLKVVGMRRFYARTLRKN
jgi:lipopolysaccharide/colanic/teichoic acid biosynthesis glycosyltransferase